MFLTCFSFELRYWLRGLMVWVFLLIVTALLLAAGSSDAVQVGGAVGNTDRNAPYVIQNFYATMSLLGMLFTTAFVNSAASRDFSCGMSQLIYTKPIRKVPFLLGRFLGAILVSLIPILGVSLGILLSPLMPWADASRFGPISWNAHLQSLLVFALPNALFSGAAIFAVAVLTRSSVASFLAAIGLLVGYSMADAITGDLDNERMAALIDPFGVRTFVIATKYWTVAEQNSAVVSLSGLMLVNRLIWIGIGGVILAGAIARFSFAERRSAARRSTDAPATNRASTAALPAVRFGDGARLGLRQFLGTFRFEVRGIVRSPVFLVILLTSLVNLATALSLSTEQGFGLSAEPVTYMMVDLIRGSMYLFLISILTFYAGVLVWREREAKLDDVFDALPYRTVSVFAAKLAALLVVVAALQLIGIAAGIASQALQGYHRHQVGLFLTELLGTDLLRFFLLMVLAFACHVVAPNRYVGYFLFVVALILNAFLGYLLDVESNLFRYGALPDYVYSDLFGLAPFAEGLVWFGLYGLAGSLLVALLSLLMWQRGRETNWRWRLAEARRRWRGSLRTASFAAVVVWFGLFGWIAWNTMGLNELTSPETRIRRQAAFEKEFRSTESNPIPTIVAVTYDIDLYPSRRALRLEGSQRFVNRHSEPIVTIPITTAEFYETTLEIDGAAPTETHDRGYFTLWTFDPPLAPGEERTMRYVVTYEPKGFENEVVNREVVQNGTFFNNGIVPLFGYQRSREVTDPNARARHGLGLPELMPALDPSDLVARGRNYLGSFGDWVTVETTISTDPDQIAIAPGSLIERWEESGRPHFRYRLDHPSLNFYSFISARYKVAVQEWNGISLEVYYHPEHGRNVDNMLRAMRAALQYGSEQFGPYRHKQARIIEFPRTATFAQAFPGTMPYSEGIGFIADVDGPDDIDMVFYVVAHEIAHQWWAHQVIGAGMQGSTLLSETLAQYTALMVMEREFGRDRMRKFLRYEMDSYLRSRGAERLAERPLRTVEASQGYVHYRKGSVVMYQLKERIGEERVNAALRSLVDRFAYREPPFPTSVDLIEALRTETPEEYRAGLDELFDTITLYGNRTVSAVAVPLDGDRYEVTIEVECRKFRADEQGAETEMPIDELLEIGAFAAPEPGRKYGDTLYRQTVRITEPISKHTFVVDRLPDTAGIDPFALLIDRQPLDNTTKVTIESAPQ